MLRQSKIVLLFLFNVILSWNGFSQDKRFLRANWEFKTNTTVEWKKATVPGCVHLDLFNIGSIGDPYVGNNELEQKWIEKYDWEYRTSIEIEANYLNNKHIELVFDGLDTYATVYLNGKEILFANNMFREWVVDVKPYLHVGSNELLLIFHSPVTYNAKKVENAPYQLPAANENVALMVSPYTRKAAYHFGWDWGPRFVSSGMWRPVSLRTWNDVRITEIQYTTSQIINNQGKVELILEIENDLDDSADYTLEIFGQSFKTKLKKGSNQLKQSIQLNNVENWNPIGYGKQNQYKSEIIVYKNSNLITKKNIAISFRSIELIQEKDSIGTSFYFKVNGKPFFAKGANYIPQDLFLTRVDSARYEKLLKQAADANINMLRVWGGGIYENDYFYDLCDEYGILVWQDFMFANSMYPNDSAFLNNVQAEVEYNVKRLRNHPCIALWCGNNEIEVAWKNWGWQKQYNYSPADSAEIWNNYVHIFHEMIPGTLSKLDPDHNYVPTTPLSNWGKAENFNHSSMHYWGVWHGKEPLENYAVNVGRFMAEYGYQSYPDYETLAKVIETKDLDLLSEVMLNRQKSYIGNGILEENVMKYGYKETDFKKWIQLSQLVQAHAYGLAIRAHRTQTPHCMGTLFWQLNDCWPGPSWSVIDYYGTEKLAYNEVRKFYAPIIATIELIENEIKTILLSDLLEPTDISIHISAENKDGRTAPVLHEALTLEYLVPVSLYKRVPQKLMRTFTKKQGFSHFHLEIKSKGEMIFETKYYLNPLSTVEFPKK